MVVILLQGCQRERARLVGSLELKKPRLCGLGLGVLQFGTKCDQSVDGNMYGVFSSDSDIHNS